VAHEIVCTGCSAVPVAATAVWPQVVPFHRSTTPAVFTEAQNEAEVHETWYSPPVGPTGAGPTGVGPDQEVPFQVSASWLFMATQKSGVGQETELNVPPCETPWGADQVRPFHVVTPPCPSTA